MPEESFDFAYSSLAFHYIEDFGRLVATIHRALVPCAHFVFTVEHPIYMASLNPGWRIGDHGERTWAVDHYSAEVRAARTGSPRASSSTTARSARRLTR